MANINQQVIEMDLYSEYVNSPSFEKCLDLIERKSLNVRDAIDNYGIGTALTDDGEYDHESGQLTSSFPRSILSEIDDSCYKLLCRLADNYALFVRNRLSKEEN